MEEIDMKGGRVQLVYAGMIMFTVILIIYSYKVTKTDIRLFQSDQYYEFEKNWNITVGDRQINNKDLPCVIKTNSRVMTISKKIHIKDQSYTTLGIRSIDQKIKVYANGKLIYDVDSGKTNSLVKTPGQIWHLVPIYAIEQDSVITIEYENVYAFNKGVIGEIMIGKQADMVGGIFRKNIIGILISMVLFVNSIFLWICSMLAKRKADNRDLLYMSVFGFLFSAWSIIETSVMQFFIPYQEVLTVISYELLTLLPIPLALFATTGEKIKNRTSRIVVISSIVNFFVVNILQLFRIMDLQESTYIVHVITLFVPIGMMVINARIFYQKKKIRNQLDFSKLGLVIFETTLFCDILRFFVVKTQTDSAVCSRFGFLIYIIILSLNTMKNLYKVMFEGRQNKIWKELAYKDVLTKVGSRLAFNETMEKLSQERFFRRKPSFVMVDINNLKQMNDRYGHFEGDVYIVECVNVIKRVFEGIGEIFRLGGDEFIVIIQGVDETLTQECMNELERANNRPGSKQQPLSFAFGRETFDSAKDKTIYDTINRADEKMYRHKVFMKADL